MGKTKIEIINETVKYYKTNNRAVTNGVAFDGAGSCEYYLKQDGVVLMCAVGRCLEYPKDFEGRIHTVSHIFGERLDNYFKEEYRGHGIGFWSDLQLLHDNHIYWNKIKGGNELTELGLEMYNRLIQTYDDAQ
jgi:hypothetical protein